MSVLNQKADMMLIIKQENQLLVYLPKKMEQLTKIDMNGPLVVELNETLQWFLVMVK